MKCKYCKREVEDDSIYCRFCGTRLVAEPRKRGQRPTVPKPRKLESGEWAAQMMIDGRRQWVKGRTKAEYTATAEALKLGVLAARPAYAPLTVGQMIDSYIERNRPVLSPSTIKGYKSVRENRFKDLMNKDVRSGIDWQMAINAEMEEVKPKTLANAWRLVTAAMKEAGVEEPRVKLPKIPRRERPWLDYDQISTFLVELLETDAECLVPALLALHGLRRSEIMALTAEDIDKDKWIIHVRGSEVYNDKGERVKKETTKSRAGTRDVPVMIEFIKPELKKIKTGPIVKTAPNTAYVQINRICRSVGLPEVGIHGLRHSFASLAYHLGWSEATTMQVGGWDDSKTVHEVYTHLAALDSNKDVEKMRAYYRGEDV